jgi:hypothetical protein
MSGDCGTSGKCVTIKAARDFTQSNSNRVDWAKYSQAIEDK